MHNRAAMSRCCRSIPLADLELVLPEKAVLVPPTVLLELAVSLVVALVAVLGTLRQVCVGRGPMTWLGCRLLAGLRAAG